ncbi:fluoride efflux transporter CrcB [Streptomyces sp. NPDC002514]|uniref:fluoride efflux transporter CrcB n=1 Tax=unclassified Streptomyces TaxID=2593676 RepID=UPI00369A4536
MGFLLVVLGGAVGAPLRYLVDRAVQARHGTSYPWGTFTVNMIGSAILGALTGAVLVSAASENVQLLVGTGFCGALTTYSTFSWETLQLAEAGSRFHAAANVVVSILAGLGSVYVGMAVAQAVFG